MFMGEEGPLQTLMHNLTHTADLLILFQPTTRSDNNLVLMIVRNEAAEPTLWPELNICHSLRAEGLPDGLIISLKIIMIFDEQAHFLYTLMECD